MNGTPEIPRSSINPPVVDYVHGPAGALRCGVCGALVDDGRELDHTTFHEMVGEVVDALAVRLAAVEEALADADARIALDPRPLLAEMPRSWGEATDRMVDSVLASLAIPPGHLRIVFDGPKDVVTPAATALADMLGLAQHGPIMRDAGNPVTEQRAYLGELDAIRSAVNRYTATLFAPRPGAALALAAAERTAERAPEAEADLGEPTGSGVVWVSLDGDPDDVDLAVELAEATAFPLVDVGAPRPSRRGPRGHVRRYGTVYLTGTPSAPRDGR